MYYKLCYVTIMGKTLTVRVSCNPTTPRVEIRRKALKIVRAHLKIANVRIDYTD